MLESCKCGENKIMTEVDGRFVYQTCFVCGDVVGVVYLGPKETEDEEYDFLGV